MNFSNFEHVKDLNDESPKFAYSVLDWRIFGKLKPLKENRRMFDSAVQSDN